MSGKHTPGPWNRNTITGDGKRIERIWLGSKTTETVARVYGESADANARLIAAAPDLLAACETALNDMGYPDPSMEGTLGKVLRAAIAKARGNL